MNLSGSYLGNKKGRYSIPLQKADKGNGIKRGKEKSAIQQAEGRKTNNMASIEELEGYFDRHDAYTKYLSLSGNRVNTSGNSPIVYITIVKFKKALKRLDGSDLSLITGRAINNSFAESRVQQDLLDALEEIEQEYLFNAFAYLQQGETHKAFQYILQHCSTEVNNTTAKDNYHPQRSDRGIFITPADLMKLNALTYKAACVELKTLCDSLNKGKITLQEFCQLEDLEIEVVFKLLRPNGI